MASDWRSRLKALFNDSPGGLSMRAASLKAGLGPGAVHDIVTKGKTPSIENFVAICEAAGADPAAILLGGAEHTAKVPVIGDMSAGETWLPIDDIKDYLDIAIEPSDSIAIAVHGDSMSPVYRDGDILVCYRRFGPNADNLIGRDCVVRTADGRCVVKILKRGSRAGRFTLKSYNPHIDDIEDVALAWAAPIAWIKRRGE